MNRREVLQTLGLSIAGTALSGWMPGLAQAFADDPKRRRHCILLWMPGGASQTDTFDMKPGHENGGEFKEIETAVPGLRISEHLPKLATQAEDLAIVRSLSTAEGDHSRGTYLMHTGHRPAGPISYPTIGSSLSKAMGSDDAELPNFVSISPYTAFNNAAFGPGFLGPRHAPLTVGATTVPPTKSAEPANQTHATYPCGLPHAAGRVATAITRPGYPVLRESCKNSRRQPVSPVRSDLDPVMSRFRMYPRVAPFL